MEASGAMHIIEDIITCVNAYVTKTKPRVQTATPSPRDAYIFAYKELIAYLKQLFVHYDQLAKAGLLGANTWSWLEFLERAHNSPDIKSIKIVTYNYDVWLERLLMQTGLNFSIFGVSEVLGSKIEIVKPHGSISFAHANKRPLQDFQIRRDYSIGDEELSKFYVTYDEMGEYYLQDAIIPPAGEAGRYNHKWATPLRERVKKIMEEITESDLLVFCGLSYWHVDRAELDELLVSTASEVEFYMVNPTPPRTLTAVLTSLFGQFTILNSSETLKSIKL